VAETGKNISGFELRVSGYEKQKFIFFELETRNAQLETVSCGFRSAHSCGAAVDLHYLPVPSRAILKNLGEPPLKEVSISRQISSGNVPAKRLIPYQTSYLHTLE
jgi:hypothetical protein